MMVPDEKKELEEDDEEAIERWLLENAALTDELISAAAKAAIAIDDLMALSPSGYTEQNLTRLYDAGHELSIAVLRMKW